MLSMDIFFLFAVMIWRISEKILSQNVSLTGQAKDVMNTFAKRPSGDLGWSKNDLQYESRVATQGSTVLKRFHGLHLVGELKKRKKK
jgi:hypothetical protein